MILNIYSVFLQLCQKGENISFFLPKWNWFKWVESRLMCIYSNAENLLKHLLSQYSMLIKVSFG